MPLQPSSRNARLWWSGGIRVIIKSEVRQNKTEDLAREIVEEVDLIERAEEEVKKLEAEVGHLEQEADKRDEEILALKETSRMQLGEIAELIQEILDRTKDDTVLRSRIKGLRDALRRQHQKPVGDYDQLDLPEVVVTTFRSTPKAA